MQKQNKIVLYLYHSNKKHASFFAVYCLNGCGMEMLSFKQLCRSRDIIFKSARNMVCCYERGRMPRLSGLLFSVHIRLEI
jgi:hypothetical protein